ncbi:MAG: hypothetical protein DMF83_26330 [Acidobacteria bacterium]|nr:MAG: hypothetical protein DMF83_26330 [Acidobacteriota bacterium]
MPGWAVSTRWPRGAGARLAAASQSAWIQGGWNEAGTGAAGRAQDRRGPGDRTQGWARELHLKLLGLPAVLPPPEEEKDVKTAIGAARAKQARKEML